MELQQESLWRVNVVDSRHSPLATTLDIRKGLGVAVLYRSRAAPGSLLNITFEPNELPRHLRGELKHIFA